MMKKLFPVVLGLLLAGQSAFASSTLPFTLEQHIDGSGAVFRGTVLAISSYVEPADNLIYTRVTLKVDEGFKGTFPSALIVTYRGGRIPHRFEATGLSPHFQIGEPYLVFVTRNPDGRLYCTAGAPSAIHLAKDETDPKKFTPEQETLLNQVRALTETKPPGEDVTDQAGSTTTKATTGLLIGGSGKSSRFLPQDRGEPIHYLIDAAHLPTGMTLTQATNAVRLALNAWSAVTSLRFQLDGVQSFGTNADAIQINDSRLRIQLHDDYNAINSANVLGVGGRAGFYTSPPLSTGWDLGGRVGTNEFEKSAYGYVVLERTNTTMQNLQTFTEVLCHEIGHALSMAHSSEVVTTNPTLTNSIMYFQAHADGRGATLGSYDPPVIQQAYPSNNTPPFTYDRMMDITTASSAPNVPGINEVELRGYDLQGTTLTIQTTDESLLNGTFSLVGNVLKYTCPNFGDSTREDPAGTGSWDDIFFRFSDGTNASPYGEVRVLSFNHDGFTPSDGIPDNWMIANFGNANPNTGLNHKASDDADGDGMKNLIEYRTGMDPNSSASAQRLTLVSPTNITFQAKPYELYELLGSTNLTNWVRAAVPLVPTTSTGTFNGFTNSTSFRFFRVLKVP